MQKDEMESMKDIISDIDSNVNNYYNNLVKKLRRCDNNEDYMETLEELQNITNNSFPFFNN